MAEDSEVTSPPQASAPVDWAVVGAKASRPAPSVVLHDNAACYEVRNGWAWAHIFIRYGTARQHNGAPRYWVHVAIISDYGSFGYCWTHIGEDWRKFLAGLDMHYAMQKFMGAHFRVPLTGEEARARAKAIVLDGRRKQGWPKTVARTLWNAAEEAETDDGCSTFLRAWDNCSAGLFYSYELWDSRWDKVNPQAEGFWRDIWPHFAAALTPQDMGKRNGAEGDCEASPNPGADHV